MNGRGAIGWEKDEMTRHVTMSREEQVLLVVSQGIEICGVADIP